MPSEILVNNLGLTYKSTIGVSMATLPDVCKTPSPGGPVPIPYPNFADQGSLDKGTKTVKAKGNMIAIKGSEYSMSSGDEPGTVGGVTSNTFKKETSWITYSFDVKLDGQNACRHTDKKFHNHKNTVDLAGNLDPAVVLNLVKCAIKECDEKNAQGKNYSLAGVPKDERCKALGTKKHACVHEKLKGKEPDIYSEASFDMGKGGEGTPEMIMSQTQPPAGTKPSGFFSAIGKVIKKYGTPYVKGTLRRPDVCTGTGPDCDIYDAKFPCPDDVESGKRSRGSMPSKQVKMPMSDDQQKAYDKIAGGGKAKSLTPMECQDAVC